MGVSPPAWIMTLGLAEIWNIPPWEVEEAPLIWVTRQAEYNRLRDAMRKMRK